MLASTALVLLMIPGVGYGINHGKRIIPPMLTDTKVLLFRSCTSKVCAVPAMAVDDGYRRHLLSMVLLGLLAVVFAYGGEVYGRFGEYRIPQCLGCALGW